MKEQNGSSLISTADMVFCCFTDAKRVYLYDFISGFNIGKTNYLFIQVNFKNCRLQFDRTKPLNNSGKRFHVR
jgi:hypothetical protein